MALCKVTFWRSLCSKRSAIQFAFPSVCPPVHLLLNDTVLSVCLSVHPVRTRNSRQESRRQSTFCRNVLRSMFNWRFNQQIKS